MTDWRDARLDKALAHAPDAEQRPAAATRAAVLRHAHAAVQAQAPARIPAADALPWWRRWFRGGSSARMPWNAAFASLLLAGVITLVWREQEIPGARTEDGAIPTAPSARPPAATVPPAAPTAAPEARPAPPASPAPRPPEAAPADARAPARAPAAKPAEPVAPPPAPARAREAAPPLAKQSPAEASGGAAPSVRDAVPPPSGEAPAAAPAPVQPLPPTAPPAAAAAPVPLPAPAPAAPMQAQPRADSADAARAAPAPAAPAAAAAPAAPQAPGGALPRAAGSLSSRMASPPAAAAAGSAAAPAPAAAAAPARPSFELWTQARVTLADRTVVVPRAQASALADGIRAMVSAASGTGEWTEPVDVRIALSRDGEDLGVLELGETAVRWTALQPGPARSRVGRPDPAQLRALRNTIDALR